MVKDARKGGQQTTSALRRLYKPAGFDTHNPLYPSFTLQPFTLQWNEGDEEVLEVYGGECDEQVLNAEEVVQESVEDIRRRQQHRKRGGVAEAGSEEDAPGDSRVLHATTRAESKLGPEHDLCAY